MGKKKINKRQAESHLSNNLLLLKLYSCNRDIAYYPKGLSAELLRCKPDAGGDCMFPRLVQLPHSAPDELCQDYAPRYFSHLHAFMPARTTQVRRVFGHTFGQAQLTTKSCESRSHCDRFVLPARNHTHEQSIIHVGLAGSVRFGRSKRALPNAPPTHP